MGARSMKLRRLLCLPMALLLAGSLVAADEPPDRETLETQDKAALKGTWVLVSAARNGGEKPSESFLKTFKLTFDGDRTFTITIEGKEKTALLTLMDPTRKPKQMDLRADGVESPWIYDLNKDMLKIVLDSKDTTRATEFKT